MSAGTEGRPRILILGGGYGGVTLAANLKRVAASGKADITLVNKSNYHYLTTLLHHAILQPIIYKKVAVNIPRLLGSGINFVRGSVQTINWKNKQVEVATRSGGQTLSYDYLVIALGWEPVFYGLPGLKEHAFVLEDLRSAHQIYTHIEESFMEYDKHPDQEWRTHIVIGGAGPTGVEIAFDLTEGLEAIAIAYDIDPKKITLVLVGKLLEVFDETLREHVKHQLRLRGIDVDEEFIERVDEHAIELKSRRYVEESVLIWCGGVRANSIIEKSGFAVDKHGRANVNNYLQSVDSPGVYVIGDCACATDERGQPLIMTAQFAAQEGKYLARALRTRLAGGTPGPYRPRNLGMFVSVGRRHAIGVFYLGRIRIKMSGTLGHLVKFAANSRYLYGIGGLRMVLKKMMV